MMIHLRCIVAAAIAAVGLAPSSADAQQQEELRARVVDVGQGLCVAVRLPDEHLLVYDAGTRGRRCADAVRALVGPGEDTIDLLVLSHTDSDHVGGVPALFDEFDNRVSLVLRTGRNRQGSGRDTWLAAVAAIEAGVAAGTTRDLNLSTATILPGATFQFGDAFVTFVAGWHDDVPAWRLSERAHRENAASIVVRVVYRGGSILLAGDTVGRHIEDPATTCLAAEQVMVDRSAAIRLDSDVLVAPHHGADNGSSLCFLHAVNPAYVVFSSGRGYEHPRQSTADRVVGLLPGTRLLRTDLGDDEGPPEWDDGVTGGDGVGDDDVDIVINASGRLSVGYR